MSRRSESILTVLAVAVAATVTGVFFTRFSAASLVLERVLELAVGALLAASAAVGAGVLTTAASTAIVRRATKTASADVPPDVPAEMLIGAASFGSLIALAAWSGFFSEAIVIGLALVAGGYGVAVRWRAVSALVRSLRLSHVLVLSPPLAIALLAALAPVNTPDELVYKLAVPRTYLLFGGMVELPLNSNSYFPNSIYMADLAAMATGESGAKLFHFLLYLAALAVAYRLSVRLIRATGVADGGGALWPVVVLAWTPALAVIAGWAWAEWAMIGLALISIERLHACLDSGNAADLATAAAALGAAASAKYTALPWIAVFVPVAIWRLRGNRQLVRLAAACALIVIMTGGLFYVRNAVWTGSPLAPFFLEGSPRVANFRSGAGGWTELARGYDIFHPGIIDDSLGVAMPAMVLLAPVALLAGGALAVDLIVIGLAQLLVLVPLAPTSRLITLAAVPLAIAGTVATRRLVRAAGRAVRLAAGALAGIAFFGQMLLVLFIFTTSWGFAPVLVGAESEEAYLARTRDYMPAYRWIETNTAPDAKLLLLGENRIFHLHRRAIAQGNLDGPRVAAWLAQWKSADDFADALRREGFTHVLVHKPWYRVERPGSPPPRMMEKEFILSVPPKTDAVVRGFLAKRARAVYNDRAFVLFELPR
jgi:hypothetical protein